MLILLPPLILLIGGPVYDKPWPRLLGSLAFGLLAFTFLLPALGSATAMSEPGLGLYVFFSNFQSLIIVIGLTLATLDVFLTRRPKSRKSH